MPRILEKLRITRVAAVDRGAGEGVKVMLMKRDEPLATQDLYDLAKADTTPAEAVLYIKRTFTADERRAATASGAAMAGGGYPIENASDLNNAVHAIGRGKAPHASIRRHIITRARALGLTDKLPDGWKVKKGLVRKLLEAVHLAKATDFETAQADTETGEYAQDMLEEFSEAIGSLAQSFASIMSDDTVTDKQGAIDATIAQFREHIEGVVPEGIEEAMRGAALAAAGYEINAQGAISKKGSDTMTDEEKKAAEAEAAKKATEHEETKKALAVAKREIAMLKMSDKHKDYCTARGDDMSDDEKDKFQAMEPNERDAHMAKHPIPEDTEKRIAAGIAKGLAADPTVISLRKRVEDMEKREETDTLRKSWAGLGVSEPQTEELLKAHAAGMAKDSLTALAKQFGALTNQVREAGLFKEFGAGGGNTAVSAHDEIMAKAAELRKADPKLTVEQAFAKAYSDPANQEIAKRDTVARREALRA